MAETVVIAILVLLVSTVLQVYILIIYPLLLNRRSGRRAPKIKKDSAYKPSVSVILAVHNGEQHIRAKIESLLALDYPKDRMEILMVSDGSTDATESIAGTFASCGVSVLRLPHGGKAAALNGAFSRATGEILFLTDVRQPLDPSALAHLAANFADPTVGAVTGELGYRGLDAGEQADMGLYWRYELWARGRHSEIDSTFTTTGCVYAIRRSLVEPIPADTLADDAVIALRAFFRGYRVVCEPEARAWDVPAAAGGEFRRRLRTLAGLWQVFARLPQLMSRTNRMRFHFFSHKFSRLLLPWLILATIAATIALPASDFRSFLLLNEALLPAVALIDFVVPMRSPLKRVTSPARTFLVMNAAALCAITVFFLPPQKLWGTPGAAQQRHRNSVAAQE